MLALVVLAAALCLLRRARSSKQVSGMSTACSVRSDEDGAPETANTTALRAVQRGSWPGQAAGRRNCACLCNNELISVRSCLADRR